MAEEVFEGRVGDFVADYPAVPFGAHNLAGSEVA
jgi:hypothetical protein